MNKTTLNIIAICAFLIIVVFAYTKTDKVSQKTFSDNISISSSTDQYDLLSVIAESKKETLEKFSSAFKASTSDNLTDSVAKDIFKNYVAYNSTGELDVEEINKLAEQSLINTKLELNLIEISSLKTVADNKENLKKYVNDLAGAIIKGNYEIVKDKKVKDQEKVIYDNYILISESLKNIEVPKILANNHRDIINSYLKFAEIIKLLKLQETDPVKALSGVKLGQETTVDISKYFENIKETIIINNIVLEKKDPAYVFINKNE